MTAESEYLLGQLLVSCLHLPIRRGWRRLFEGLFGMVCQHPAIEHGDGGRMLTLNERLGQLINPGVIIVSRWALKEEGTGSLLEVWFQLWRHVVV